MYSEKYCERLWERIDWLSIDMFWGLFMEAHIIVLDEAPGHFYNNLIMTLPKSLGHGTTILRWI